MTRSARIAWLTPLVLSGCLAGVTWGRPGPTLSALTGIWVDSSKATPTDTVAWMLTPEGYDMTLAIKVTRDSLNRPTSTRTETRHGFWYLQGSLADTAGRALCFKKRPRDGPTCSAFRLDTIRAPVAAPSRRRLLVLSYSGRVNTRDRVLLERLRTP